MKSTLGALLALATLLGFPATGHAQDTFDQYAPLHLRRGGLLVDQASRQWMSEWATNPTSPTHTDVSWGNPKTWPADNSQEEWEIKQNCSGGNAWVWVNAFRNDATGARYPLSTTRATYTDLTTGQTFDITSGGACGTAGQPYAVYNVYNSPYVVKVWGNIYNNGVVSKRFFWQQTIRPFQTVTNVCWTGPGGNVRTAIRQDEAWWDSVDGWAFGSSGSLGANGEPDGIRVNYGRYQTIAKGVGYAWTYQQFNQSPGCLQSQWSW
jgi:hypothetical protein